MGNVFYLSEHSNREYNDILIYLWFLRCSGLGLRNEYSSSLKHNFSSASSVFQGITKNKTELKHSRLRRFEKNFSVEVVLSSLVLPVIVNCFFIL